MWYRGFTSQNESLKVGGVIACITVVCDKLSCIVYKTFFVEIGLL